MSTSWMRCCLDRPILKRRARRGSGTLDERFGDPAISGPMEGGWNQFPEPQRHSGVSHSRKTSSEKPFGDETTERSKSISKDKPNFVYKPASGDFLKNMAELGRPKQSPNSVDAAWNPGHNSHYSVHSASSLDPTSPNEIPRHPSHQIIPPHNNSPRRRSTSPVSTPTCHPLDQFLDRQKPAMSPNHSIPTPSTIDEETTSYTTTTDYEKQAYAETPSTSAPTPTLPSHPDAGRKKWKNRPKRAVTSEMVPSTTELFG
ncbi:hypothetical protein FQN57_007047 [Myotisia sp. PD_48]|nr:hypothetical protein FQN57_007047 [Myotisia sp. PD_48]